MARPSNASQLSQLCVIGILGCCSAWTHTSAAAEARDATCKALSHDDFTVVQDGATEIIDSKVVESDKSMPAYCRVQGYTAPQIGFELYLPLEGWNKKFLQIGCIGHCGITELVALCPLQKGYACIAADDGHKSTPSGALWGNENWQAKIDWGYRAPHVTAQAGKAIIHRFYGTQSARSYFLGQSTGGRQALQEAQRFPWDFDGVVAINPPPDLSAVYMTFAWGRQALHDTRGEPLLNNAELKLLTDSAVAKCDLSDGVKDGIIGDPLHCSFDPSELACKPHQVEGCLSPTQIDAIKKVYAGPTTSSGIRLTHGGPLPGSEFGNPIYDNGWSESYLNDDSGTVELATLGLRYLFFSSDPGHRWTLRDFDFDRDYRSLGVMEALYDASNPDLRVFKKAQGKLMIFQGLNDVAALPRSTIDYYEAVERVMGGRRATQDFVRLFLVPGVDHVHVGPGAATIDYLKALEDWVEEGRAPDRLIAVHLKHVDDDGRPLDPSNVQFTRPLYPYPLRAKYRGRGNPADAESFVPVD